MINLHIEGGMIYMAILSILFIANLVMIAYAFYLKYVKLTDSKKLSLVIHHISLIALVWGVLSTSVGLFNAFGSMAKMETTLPLNVIMGGLRVAMITAIYGMIIFVVSRAGLVFLKPWSNA
jgi:hypothetical protein